MEGEGGGEEGRTPELEHDSILARRVIISGLAAVGVIRVVIIGFEHWPHGLAVPALVLVTLVRVP